MNTRNNEIGVDVHRTTETENSKGDTFEVGINETQHEFEYPNLRPGRALLALDTGELVEFHHPELGVTDASEGRRSSIEEYYDWKYNNQKGQDWGGIIQKYQVTFVRRDAPVPNDHFEIPAATDRPASHELTSAKPETFKRTILFDGDQPRPLLLLERPAVSYDEAAAGETYTCLGWFDQLESDAGERVKHHSEISSKHPAIVGGDAAINHDYELENLDIAVAAGSVESANNFAFSQTENDYDVEVVGERGEIHATLGTAFGDTRFIIDAPYDANEYIKQLGGQPRWNPDHNAWAVIATNETLQDMIATLSATRWNLTVDSLVVEKIANRTVTVDVEDVDEASFADIEAFAFDDTASEPKPMQNSSVDENRSPMTEKTTSVDVEDMFNAAAVSDSLTSLSALDAALASNEGTGLTISVKGDDVATSLPESIDDEWRVSLKKTDEDSYKWYHPLTGTAISVTPVEGWGTEYEITVTQSQDDRGETVTQIADETMAVRVAMQHMMAISS